MKMEITPLPLVVMELTMMFAGIKLKRRKFFHKSASKSKALAKNKVFVSMDLAQTIIGVCFGLSSPWALQGIPCAIPLPRKNLHRYDFRCQNELRRNCQQLLTSGLLTQVQRKVTALCMSWGAHLAWKRSFCRKITMELCRLTPEGLSLTGTLAVPPHRFGSSSITSCTHFSTWMDTLLGNDKVQSYSW